MTKVILSNRYTNEIYRLYQQDIKDCLTCTHRAWNKNCTSIKCGKGIKSPTRCIREYKSYERDT
jgi:hypothetical protein